MSFDLILKPSCGGCGSTTDLYGSTCKHLTLCVNCGKSMAQNRSNCYVCATPITRLIREYNVRASSNNDKNYFIARFDSGLPNFKKKNHNKWSFQKEGLQGRQVTATLREKFKNKPWLLEDETRQFQYRSHIVLEGTQPATYYLLMLQGKEFVAIPAGSWYNFSKVAQYKQFTLEEAEEMMKNRRRIIADGGFQRWIMKAAHNGAAASGEVETNASDRGDEDDEDEAARKSRLGLNKKSCYDDDEEGPRGGDLDFDDDDIEKGDDWEHDEIFTDDDEAVGIDPQEREDLAPEIHAPPEIKQDDEDEDEEGEEGGLSISGKELKKLLGRANGMNDSDAEDDADMEEDISPLLAQKKEAPKEEPVDNSSPLKATTSADGRGAQSNSKLSKGKRKSSGEESKIPNSAPLKKVKTEIKPGKDENASSSTSVTGPVTEDQIRTVLMQNKSMTTGDLVAIFSSRLQCLADKDAFADIMRRISKIRKTSNGSFLVLSERQG